MIKLEDRTLITIEHNRVLFPLKELLFRKCSVGKFPVEIYWNRMYRAAAIRLSDYPTLVVIY